MIFDSTRWLRMLFLLVLSSTVWAGDGWRLVWHDEFNKDGPPDPKNWDYEHGFVRNKELQWYQPENAFCTNGMLIIEARPEHNPNPIFSAGGKDWRTKRQWIDYTSASLVTKQKHEFTYGKFEMRARIDTRLGSWPAFWTIGDTKPHRSWPACGEIDIMEFYTSKVLANICYGRGGKQVWSTVRKPLDDLGGESWSKEFHSWTMVWNSKSLDLLLDGKVMNHFDVAKADDGDGGNPFHEPLYLILNQAIGATGGDPSKTKFPVRYEIDWVRVYQRDDKAP